MSSDNGAERLSQNHTNGNGTNGTLVDEGPRERIIWTDEEHEQIADAMVKILLNHPGEPYSGLIAKAISVLPAHRRRNIQGIKLVPKLEKVFQRKLTEFKDLAKKGAEPPPPKAAPLPPPPPEIVRIERDPQEILDALHPAQLLVQFFSRVWQEVEDLKATALRIEDLQQNQIVQIQAIMAKASRHDAAPAAKVKKVRVAVFGLLQVQYAQVEAALAHKFDLKYISKDSMTFPEVDYYVLAKKFISHSQEAAARSRYKQEQVLALDGSGDRIAQQIEKLCKPV